MSCVMKKILIIIFLSGHVCFSNGQANRARHHGTFDKNKTLMSSNSYEPDD